MVKLITILCIISASYALSQNSYTTAPKNDQKQYDSFEDRLYYGGNVGAWFGTTTFVNLSPIVGCHITEKLSAGVGAIYNYYSVSQNGSKYSTSIYGGNTFARYQVLENIFLQAGWDRINVPNYTNNYKLDARAWTDNVLVGGGYKQPISDNGSFVMMIFYNVNQTLLSPYPNPIIQMGFNLGF